MVIDELVEGKKQ